MSNEVDLVIGAVLRRELLRRGYVIVPMAPSHEMQDHAHKAQTGTFSNWALLPLWFQLLSFADPEAQPHLDKLLTRLRREEPHYRPPPPATRKK